MSVAFWVLFASWIGLVLLVFSMAGMLREQRAKVKHLANLNDILIGVNPDTDDVHIFDPPDRNQIRQEHDDWLTQHPGVTPKPGYERKRR